MPQKRSFFALFIDNSRLMSLVGVGGTVTTFISIVRSENPDFVQIAVVIAFILLFIVFFVIEIRKKDRKKSEIDQDDDIIYEPNLPVHELCETLLETVTSNNSIIKRSNIEEDARSILQDVRDGILRIYLFGHQSAGKSSLTNALLNSEISPISSSKMTTCLIRIRTGTKFSGIVKWENETKKIKPDIKSLKNRMAEWGQSSFEHQPIEVIIEVPDEILGIPKIELVDTPGTGSTWDIKYGKNILDETVNKKIRTAAVAILIYKHEHAEMQSHGSLLNELKVRNIKVIGVCNITPDLEYAYKRDNKDFLDTITKAEHQLRENAKAECRRVVLEEDESLIKLARQINGETVNEFRNYFIEILNDRESFVKLQAIRESLSLIEDLLVDANKLVRKFRPVFDTILTRKTEIKDAIASVRKIINKGFDDENIVTQATVVGGATLGLGGMAAVYLLGSAVTGGLLLPAGGLFLGGLAGSAIGSGMKHSKLTKFEEELATAWNHLRQVINKAKVNGNSMLSTEVIRKVNLHSSSLSKYQKTLESNMTDVENDIESNLRKIEGYESYQKSEVLIEQLTVLKSQFKKHLS